MTKDRKNIALPIAAVIVVAIAVVSIVVPKLTKDNISASQNITQSDTASQNFSGDIIIDESSVTETAAFYDYDADGTAVEVFAVKASDGTTRIALNTCQICKGSPYAYFVQQGDNFICQNCNNSFNRDDIGIVHGGCNPVPVTDSHYIKEDKNIIISSEFLNQYKNDFSNWKNF